MGYFNLSISLLLVLLCTSCRPADNSSELKFLAAEQDKRKIAHYQDSHSIIFKQQSPFYLINKIHRSLRIKLDIKASCQSERMLSPFHAQNFVTDALHSWIRPILEEFHLPRVQLYSPLFIQDFEDLLIVFDCRYDEGGKSIPSNFHFYQGSNLPPKIHLFPKMDLSSFRGKTLEDFPLSTLIHELGHAFGLADTYIIHEDWTQDGEVAKHNRSSDDNPNLLGLQPRSIMNEIKRFIEPQKDDIQGLYWLYQYYVTGRAGLDSCPLGYFNESLTGGCVPGKSIYQDKNFQVILKPFRSSQHSNYTAEIPYFISLQGKSTKNINQFYNRKIRRWENRKELSVDWKF